MEKIRRNQCNFVLTLVLLLFVSLMLMACASSSKEDKVKQESISVERKIVESKVTEEETVETTPVPTPEPTAEPTPEPITYDGIDMESTLSGKEWIGTFIGVVDKPTFVVFNDDTNKKVIVEKGGTVEFAEGDTLAFFSPDGYSPMMAEGKSVEMLFCWNGNYAEVMFNQESPITKQLVSVQYMNNKTNKINKLGCYIEPPQDEN